MVLGRQAARAQPVAEPAHSRHLPGQIGWSVRVKNLIQQLGQPWRGRGCGENVPQLLHHRRESIRLTLGGFGKKRLEKFLFPARNCGEHRRSGPFVFKIAYGDFDQSGNDTVIIDFAE